MKVTILHDWLRSRGGAEEVLKELLHLYPEAPLYTLVDHLSPLIREELLGEKVPTTHWIQRVPTGLFPLLFPLLPTLFRGFKLPESDLIISSSWSFGKNILPPEGALHICYCHTPPRYIWDLYWEYRNQLPLPLRPFFGIMARYLRKQDLKFKVDQFIANSKFVAERIERIYRRKAKVIYPPVDLDRIQLGEEREREEFYLVVSRLVPYKKIDLIIEAFNSLGKELIIIGDGPQRKRLERLAGPTVQLLGYQSDGVVAEYYRRAKGFVYGALEDFGIAVVEAMGAGTPVVAYRVGGTGESVIDGVTGILYSEQSVAGLVEGVKRLEQQEWNREQIRAHALKFKPERFRQEFRQVVEELLERRG
ncbi:MAG: glycosyltransferase [Campylobacterales bacterium]